VRVVRGVRAVAVLVGLVGAAAALLLVGLPAPSAPAPTPDGVGAAPVAEAAASSGGPLPAAASTGGPLPAAASTGGPLPAAPAATAALPADRRAGVLARTVPPTGPGTFAVVPGETAGPGPGPVRRVRVEVEEGLPVDVAAFGAFVLEVLNDPRGWGHGGALTFAGTTGDADIVVVLASPATSERMCRPLVTRGTLSCRTGPRAVITHHRWVGGHPDYGDDLDGYRRYVVNHEVGHVLGHGHEFCPGPGELAPVMQQQTLGLRGCAPNPWPHPG
jgi:hypothetical protein